MSTPGRSPLLLACALLAACHGNPRRSVAAELTLATWNLEWLVSGSTALAARRDCAAARRAHVPCDVAVDQARDSADVAALAQLAARLDADVIAFQEVEDEATAARVFRGYRFCLAGSTGVQDVGFAVRPGIPFTCGPHLPELALGGRSRRGAGLVLFPGTPQALRLLAVHLKSGCSTAALDAGLGACATLAAQAEPLSRWIRERIEAGDRYVLLGDFNRDLRGDARGDSGLWPALAWHPAGPHRDAVERPFRNCYPGQPFSAYIDYILPGDAVALREVPGSFRRVTFEARAVRRRQLSDHCPVSVAFRLSP